MAVLQWTTYQNSLHAYFKQICPNIAVQRVKHIITSFSFFFYFVRAAKIHLLTGMFPQRTIVKRIGVTPHGLCEQI